MLFGCLQESGGELEIYDDDERTPVLYAIEECHFEVVKLFRHHIFLQKCEGKRQKGLQNGGDKRSLRETSLLKAQREALHQASPPSSNNSLGRQEHQTSHHAETPKTPNRLYYNYDVTSPYYINITHRRDKPQPSYPDVRAKDTKISQTLSTTLKNNKRSSESKGEKKLNYSEEEEEEGRNDKPKTDNLMTTKSVNLFTLNQENLMELSKNCRAEHSRMSMIEIWRQKVEKSRQGPTIVRECANEEVDNSAESIYETAGEAEGKSPNNKEYFLQMTEAYVHTDDENGLVFYETKLLANPVNPGNFGGKEQTKEMEQSVNCSQQSRSTNLTLPLDYETDALRTELIKLGEPPGPITKTTKRLYIKKLIKYQRKLGQMRDLQGQGQDQLSSK